MPNASKIQLHLGRLTALFSGPAYFLADAVARYEEEHLDRLARNTRDRAARECRRLVEFHGGEPLQADFLWLNPPFSLAKEFAQGLIDECNAQRIPASVSLWNAATDTAWFHLLARRFMFSLTRGRIAFLGRDGKPVEGNRQGQVLFYTGPDGRAFVAAFGGTFGEVCEARR